VLNLVLRAYTWLLNSIKQSDIMNNRRTFIQKLGVFSTLCLTGIPNSFEARNALKDHNGLIIKAEEGEVRYIGDIRKARVTIKVSKTTGYTPEMSLLSELITPGDGIPIHKHLNEEEFLLVQKGIVEITLGDDIRTGEPGDLIYVPRGMWHGFQNKGEEDVVVFFGYSPSGFEDYFRQIGTVRNDEELGFTEEDWIRTNKKYGVVYKR